MIMTKVDNNTCHDKWWNTTKTKGDLDDYDKGEWQHLSW